MGGDGRSWRFIGDSRGVTKRDPVVRTETFSALRSFLTFWTKIIALSVSFSKSRRPLFSSLIRFSIRLQISRYQLSRHPRLPSTFRDSRSCFKLHSHLRWLEITTLRRAVEQVTFSKEEYREGCKLLNFPLNRARVARQGWTFNWCTLRFLIRRERSKTRNLARKCESSEYKNFPRPPGSPRCLASSGNLDNRAAW